MGDFKKMSKAYQASSKILEKRMEKERPQDLEILKKVSDTAIVIVRGSYDKIELVLDLIKIPYVLIDPYQVSEIKLKPDQILIINCPGSGIAPEGLDKIKEFVKRGGFLFTTDWALLHILEPLFPDYVKYNQKPTGDDCVSVQVVDKSNKFLEGLFNDQIDPIWWLESSSYPIQIINEKAVKILVTSKEMKKKYGEPPIVITFDFGDGGTILHMTSHYYLQRTELRSQRHQKSAADYVISEMAFSKEDIRDMKEDLEGVNLAEAESAYSTTQFISNVIVEQQKKVQKRLKKQKDLEK